MANISKIEVDGVTYDIEDTVARQSGSGLSNEAKTALLAIFQKVAYIDANGQDYYDALEAALYPPANLVSISAVYSGGTVYSDQTLDSLRDNLVVTAHFDDYSTQTVTTYTLSGTLTEGTSTITVAYGGKTTTFTVTVAGSKFAVEYQGNFTTTTPSDTRVSLITGQITLMYGETLTLSVASGYKIFGFIESGTGGDASLNRTPWNANSIKVNAVRLDNSYVYKDAETVVEKGTGATRIKCDQASWTADGGTITYTIMNSAISGITFDGLGFYVEKTSGANITTSEAKSAVSWVIE